MKKFLNIFAIATLALFTLQSCLHDDDEVFADKAAVRINKSVEDVKKQLTSSSNGWKMKYYTGAEYTGSGMNMLMKFDNQYAYLSTDNVDDPTLVQHSTWTVNKDQGPVISFDTYLPLLHSMSDPSSSVVNGQEADYEFIVQRMTEDSIFVKGKKWGNKMVMVRIAEDVNWAEFIEARHHVKETLSENYETEKGTKIQINLKKNRMFVAGDGTGVAFTIEPNGLCLRDTVTIDGEAVSFINYDAETTDLSTPSTGTWIPALPPLTSVFLNNTWYFDSHSMSARMKLYFQQGVNGSASIGETVEYMLFQPDDPGYAAFVFKSGDNIGYFWFEAAAKEEDVIELNMYSYDTAVGKPYATSYGYNYVYSALWDTFKITVDNPKKPTELTLESTTDARFSCTLYKKEVLYPFGN